VQLVNRRNADFGGYAGTISSGRLTSGDRIKVMPSGFEAKAARIVDKNGDLPFAVQGQPVAVVLDREIDVQRGDVICGGDDPVTVSDQFAVHLLWMAPDAMFPGRRYDMKIGANSVRATVTSLKYKVGNNTLEHLAGTTLGVNEIGVCNISLDRAIPFEPYSDSRVLGSFFLVDRATNDTVGMGRIDFSLSRATNIQWQSLAVSRNARALQKDQKPCVIWFTGLSGAGKSTIATILEKRLFDLGMHTYVLDGDNVRHGLNRDLGFTVADRVENIRRIAEVASLMADAGLIVLVAFISPFRTERQMARDLIKAGEFIEVFVDAPLELCESRDPKGLYRKARRHEIFNFTGIDSPYEPPLQAEVVLDSSRLSADEAVERLLAYLQGQVFKNPG
jgi:bifunctional enzyme CysN/CysC